MKTYEATGKTYEEALQSGLEALHATISDVTIDVLEEGSKGLFGLFGSRPYKLRLTLREVEQEEEEDDDPLAELLDSVKVAEPAPVQVKPVQVKPAQPKPAQVKPVQPKPVQPKPVQPKPVQVKPAVIEQKPVESAPVAEAKADEATNAAENQAYPENPAKPVNQENPAKPINQAMPAVVQRTARPKKERQPRPAKNDNEQKPVNKPERKPLPPKAPAVPLEKPVVTYIPDDQVDPDSPAGRAQSFLKELTHLMGVDVTVAVGNDAEGNVFVQMTGDTLGILIGRRGETLDALQYLTSLHINKGQEHYTRVTLDTENYRAKREDTLIRLANRMANRAVKTGRKVSLEPMNPYERRIIHSALQPNELVDTHSEGEEPKRHIVITLRK